MTLKDLPQDDTDQYLWFPLNQHYNLEKVLSVRSALDGMVKSNPCKYGLKYESQEVKALIFSIINCISLLCVLSKRTQD